MGSSGREGRLGRQAAAGRGWSEGESRPRLDPSTSGGRVPAIGRVSGSPGCRVQGWHAGHEAGLYRRQSHLGRGELVLSAGGVR
ncbi:hypothetical protein TIFTF001_041595, partial [Ficus carica]